MTDLSPLELAFLGDAIHTLFVREYALENIKKPINEINKFCAGKCSAVHQSEVLLRLELSQEEQEIVRRARNAKAKHSAKNADVKDYKFATSFEALVAYLKITKQDERLREVLLESIK